MRKVVILLPLKLIIRRDFKNERFEKFCEKLGIKHYFSSPKTPQENGVVERKNRYLEELARTLLNETNLLKYFWADAVNTVCYMLNRVKRSLLKKIPYELSKGRKPKYLILRFLTVNVLF